MSEEPDRTTARSAPLGPWAAYGVAIAATAATLGLRLAIDARLGGQPTLVVFTVPIMLSAYLGGLRGGLLATGLSIFGANYCLLPPVHSLSIASPADAWQLMIVIMAGVVISVLNEALHRARRRADLANRREFQRATELAIASAKLAAALDAVTSSEERYRRAAEEIRHLNTDLERRVVERTAQLQTANNELESFSYSVSHDLRSPLRCLDGFSAALLEDYADKLDAEGKENLCRIRAASQRMGQLIDDLLNLSRVTRVEMTRERVDMSKMAREVAEELRGSDPGREAEFIIAGQLAANTDSRLLRIVLTNLLGNAWKFTARRERARIEFGCTSDGGIESYFVRDNGAGFDMHYATKLFGAFQRLHGASEFPGTGIGLATVQRIVHRHGGRIWAAGKPDGGATFRFTLAPAPLGKAA